MKAKTIRFSLFLLLVSGLLTALISCGGSSSSSGDTTSGPDHTTKMQLSGLLVNPPKKEQVAQVNILVDSYAVWAIPVAKLQGSSISPFNVALKIVAPVDPVTGSFTLDLPKYFSYAEILVVEPDVASYGSPGDYFEVDWLLLIMDGIVPMSFVELTDATSGLALTSFPVTKSDATTLDLGEVNRFTGEATLSLGDAAASFTLTIDQLLSIARVDDVFKSIKNLIVNADFSTTPPKVASGETHFVFGDSAWLKNSVNIAFDDPGVLVPGDLASVVPEYLGYQMSFDLNDYYANDGLSVCTGTSSYSLVPPFGGNVTVAGRSYGMLQPPPYDRMFSGDGNPITPTTADGESFCFRDHPAVSLPSSTETNISIYSSTETATGEWGLEFITGDDYWMLADVLPAGDWSLNKVGEPDYFYFDFAVSNPVDIDQNPLVFIPAMRFDTVVDGTIGDKITNVYVKWLQWDSATSTFVAVDQTVLATMLGNFEIGIADDWGLDSNPERRYEHVNGITNFSQTNPLDVSSLGAGDPFYFGFVDTNTFYDATYIGVSYQLGGSNFRFVWRPMPK